jgi:hypothetical protein
MADGITARGRSITGHPLDKSKDPANRKKGSISPAKPGIASLALVPAKAASPALTFQPRPLDDNDRLSRMPEGPLSDIFSYLRFSDFLNLGKSSTKFYNLVANMMSKDSARFDAQRIIAAANNSLRTRPERIKRECKASRQSAAGIKVVEALDRLQGDPHSFEPLLALAERQADLAKAGTPLDADAKAIIPRIISHACRLEPTQRDRILLKLQTMQFHLKAKNLSEDEVHEFDIALREIWEESIKTELGENIDLSRSSRLKTRAGFDPRVTLENNGKLCILMPDGTEHFAESLREAGQQAGLTKPSN